MTKQEKEGFEIAKKELKWPEWKNTYDDLTDQELQDMWNFMQSVINDTRELTLEQLRNIDSFDCTMEELRDIIAYAKKKNFPKQDIDRFYYTLKIKETNEYYFGKNGKISTKPEFVEYQKKLKHNERATHNILKSIKGVRND